MRAFLAKHFPTLARLTIEEWAMLGLTAGICWSILYGVALPYIIDPHICFEMVAVCY